MATTRNPTLLHAITTNRDDAVRLAQTNGTKDTLALLKRADAELAQRLRLARGLQGEGKDTFTARQAEIALKNIRDVTRQVQRSLLTTVQTQGTKAADLATGNMLDYMERANRQFKGLGEAPLPIKEAGMLTQAKAGVNASILRRLTSEDTDETGTPKQGILARYGALTVASFEEELSLSVLTGKSWEDTRNSLIGKSPFLQSKPAFWADRIVRSEIMGAYNRTCYEVINEANEQLGDMVKILAATFDDRTGWDSYQVHGQIRRPNEAFQWQGGFYQSPPNRPNDREIVVPHRVVWPIPAYLRWRSDGEVTSQYFKHRRTGSPGPRPPMTTIPLELFGKEQPKKDKSTRVEKEDKQSEQQASPQE